MVVAGVPSAASCAGSAGIGLSFDGEAGMVVSAKASR